MKPKVYGNVFATNASVQEMDVGHISGGLLRYAPDGAPSGLEVHIGDPQQPQKLFLSFGDAMFLLSMLRAIQLDHEIDLPDDPRG